MPVVAAARAPAGRRAAVMRGGVVLQPGQSPGAVQPDAAQEADLADRRADVRRQPAAGGQHQQHVPPGPRQSRRPRRRPRPRTPSAEHRPRQRGQAALASARRARRGRTSCSHSARRRLTSFGADPGDPHLLAGGGGRRACEEVARPGGCAGRHAPRPRARPRGATTHAPRSARAKTSSRSQRRVDRAPAGPR